MKKILITFFSSLGIVATLTAPAFAAVPSFCDTTLPPKPAVCDEIAAPATQNPVVKTISSAIKILSYVIGVGSVIMIMVGGFRYVVSNGDPQRIKAAKDTVMYAAVGVVVAVAAQLIVVFILNKV